MNKPVYKYKVAQFLTAHGAEPAGSKKGIIPGKPDKTIFYFKNNERLLKAFDLYHAAK